MWPIAKASVSRGIGFLTAMLASAAVLSAPAYGATWTTQPTFGSGGLAESALTSASCVSASSCMAVGVDDDGYDSSQTSLEDVGSFAESWNGSAWTVLPSAGSAAANLGLYAVSCVSAVFCVTVGESHSDGGEILDNEGVSSRPARALVEVWNGLAWMVQPDPGAGLWTAGCSACRAPRADFASRSEKTAITGWSRPGTEPAGASDHADRRQVRHLADGDLVPHGGLVHAGWRV